MICEPKGRSLRIHPPSYPAHHLLHADESGAQHPLTLTRAKGEPSCTPSVVYHPLSPHPLRECPEGAKPPHTPAVVLRPLFSSGVLRKRGRYPHPLRFAQAPVILSHPKSTAGFSSEKEEGGSRRGVMVERIWVFSGIHPAVFMCREGRLV